MEEKTTGYIAPDIHRMELKGMEVLCQSPNRSMDEIDFGDGGFNEN